MATDPIQGRRARLLFSTRPGKVADAGPFRSPGAILPPATFEADPMSDRPIPTLLDMTPGNPVYQADPHVVLDDLRGRCPAREDPVSGGLILTRYEDVRGVFNNRA